MLAAGAFFFHRLYLVPLHDRQEEARAARDALAHQEERIQKVDQQKSQLDEWRKESLPSDIELGKRRYDEFLRDLMTKNGFKDYQVKENEISNLIYTVPQADKKAPPYTPLTFTVTGRADLSQVVKLLEQFYHTPLLHKIKDLKIKRASGLKTTRDVDIELKVEAIKVSDAEDRPDLFPGPSVAVHHLAVPPRDYAAIAARNILYGPPPPPTRPDDGPDPANSIKLMNITRTEQGWEAWLHNYDDNKSWHLRPQDGYVIFQIRYPKRGLLRLMGEVLRIDDQDIVFRAQDKHYRIVLGQTLADALRKPLSDDQVKALGLTQGAGERLEGTPASVVEGHPRGFPGLQRISTP
jgi:hypothetical protein